MVAGSNGSHSDGRRSPQLWLCTPLHTGRVVPAQTCRATCRPRPAAPRPLPDLSTRVPLTASGKLSTCLPVEPTGLSPIYGYPRSSNRIRRFDQSPLADRAWDPNVTRLCWNQSEPTWFKYFFEPIRPKSCRSGSIQVQSLFKAFDCSDSRKIQYPTIFQHSRSLVRSF